MKSKKPILSCRSDLMTCAELEIVFEQQAVDHSYPKDLVKHAMVIARLHFDSVHLFDCPRFLYDPNLYYKSKGIPVDRIQYL